VQAQHVFASANADAGNDAFDSYLASTAFDISGLLAKIIYLPAMLFFVCAVLVAAAWCKAENSSSLCMGSLARAMSCGKMGTGMRSALTHRPERFLPALTNTYKQFLPEDNELELTDIEKRDGWVDGKVKLPGTRLEVRCVQRNMPPDYNGRIGGEEVPTGSALATWQVSALQGCLVSYALQDNPQFGSVAHALAAAAATESGLLDGGLRQCLGGEAWLDWPEDEDGVRLPVQRSDGTFDSVQLLEYQEYYRRSRRQEFASSVCGRLMGQQVVNSADRALTACQLRTGCCTCLRPFDISMDQLRRDAPREADSMADRSNVYSAKAGVPVSLHSPSASPPRRSTRTGATGILVLPRHPDDSSSDEEAAMPIQRPVVGTPESKARAPSSAPRLPRILPPLATRSSKVAAGNNDSHLI
jgi:hypothetical protein